MQELAQGLAMVLVPAALGIWTVAMIDLGLYSPRYFLPVASGLFYICCVAALYATYVGQTRPHGPRPSTPVKSDGCISACTAAVWSFCPGIYAS